MIWFDELSLFAQRWKTVRTEGHCSKFRRRIFQTRLPWVCLFCWMAWGTGYVGGTENAWGAENAAGAENATANAKETPAKKPQPEVVDYFTQFVSLDPEQQGYPAENGFGDFCAALGPVGLGQKELARQVAWDDFPDDPRSGEWYHETWLPLCERFHIDPTVKPAFLEYRDLAEYLEENPLVEETSEAMERVVSDEDEAASWNSAEAKAYQERFENAPWTETEYPQVAAWLAETSPLLDLWTRAIEKPYFTPYDRRVSLLTMEPSRFLIIRLLTASMQIRINAAIAKNEPTAKDAAMRDVLTLFRLSRCHLQRKSAQIWRLYAYAVEARAEQALRLLVLHGNLTSQQLETLAEQIRSLPPIGPPDAVLRGEEIILLDAMQRAVLYYKKDELPDATWLNLDGMGEDEKDLAEGLRYLPPNLTEMRCVIHECFGELRLAAAESDCQRRHERIEKVMLRYCKGKKRSDLNMMVSMIFRSPTHRSKLVAEVMLALFTPAVEAFLRAHERMQSQENLVILGIALERYQRLHGKYPPSLDSLVEAGLLDEIPMDPYSGLPYAYRPEPFEPIPLAPPGGVGRSMLHQNRQASPYLLYSIGRDRIDQTRTFRAYYNDDLRF